MNSIKSLFRFITLSLFIPVFFVGCATMAHGTKQEIAISTTPPGAIISSGDQKIVSPGSLQLHRGKDHILSISKPGHKTEIITMTRVVSGATAGNIVIPGGLLGWGIDAMSGAQWKFELDTIDLHLLTLPEGQKDTAAHTIAIVTSLKEENKSLDTVYESLKKMVRKSARAENS